MTAKPLIFAVNPAARNFYLPKNSRNYQAPPRPVATASTNKSPLSQTPTISLFEIISRKNRESILPEIAAEFGRQYLSFKGILSGDVTTAFPITDELRNQFKAIVSKAYGKEVVLKENVNKEIIYSITVYGEKTKVACCSGNGCC